MTITRTRFDNGLTLLTQEQHAAPVVAIQVWVNAGSADETDAISGIAHVHEHMLFKGTEKRGLGEIARAVEAAGGTLDDVVSLRLYMPNYKPSEWQDVAAGLKENFPGANPPATTWIGITSLASADYLIEIEAFAVVGK